MSSIALIHWPENLRVLVASGNRPTVVGTWSPAVAAEARTHGVPVVLEDAVLQREEREEIQRHTDALVAELCGRAVPTGEGWSDWGWWALEFPLTYLSAQGARTRQVVAALLDAAPGTTRLFHDAEGWLTGAVLALTCEEHGLQAIAFKPQDGHGDDITKRHDFSLLPFAQDGVRTDWQGRQLRKSPVPNIVMIHTNEVAHLVGALVTPGSRYFNLVQDAREPWPRHYVGQAVDARPLGPLAPLEAPTWPAHLREPVAPWEREIAEHLYVTYQPQLREARLWAEAAYGAGRIRAFLGGSDHLPVMRARLLACRALGIPFVLVQHGAFLSLQPGRYAHPNHRYADHNLVWSRDSARQLDRVLGAHGRATVIGWPQVAAAAPLVRRDRARALRTRPRLPWVLLPSGTGTGADAVASYAAADDFLGEALAAIRAVDPAQPVVVKCHPLSDNVPFIEARCRAAGLTHVEVVTGLDPWRALEPAGLAICAVSTTVFAAAALGVPVVVHSPGPNRWFARFGDVPVTTTGAELEAFLREPARWQPSPSLARHAREDAAAGPRTVAFLRGLLGTRRPPAAAPASARDQQKLARRRTPRRPSSAYLPR